MRRATALGFFTFFVLSAPAYAEPSVSGPASSPMPTDAEAPSQALRVDRARPAVRLLVSLVLRAPFDRGYGVAFAYVPTRAVEVGAALALREDRALELGTSVGLHPLPTRLAGLMARATFSAVLASSGGRAPTAGRVDAGIGYGALASGVYLELVAGASYRIGRGYEHAPWALSVAARIGFGF